MLRAYALGRPRRFRNCVELSRKSGPERRVSVPLHNDSDKVEAGRLGAARTDP